MKISLSCFLLATMFFPHKAPSCTPPIHRAWISAVNSSVIPDRDTLWFGYDPTATACADTQLCEGGFEFPPPPPVGVFDVRFQSSRGSCIDSNQADPKRDYRAYVSAAKIDTYLVKFDPGFGGSPMIFSWSPQIIRAIYDSARLRDVFGGIFINVNMGTSSSFAVPSPPHLNLVIITYGQTLTEVQPPSNEIPTEFTLAQNYPNPFNPGTRIVYGVKSRGSVSLRVYDLLGRVVATLVNEERPAGTYEVTFDASGLASGVYVYRLQAGDFVQTKKLMVVR